MSFNTPTGRAYESEFKELHPQVRTMAQRHYDAALVLHPITEHERQAVLSLCIRRARAECKLHYGKEL